MSLSLKKACILLDVTMLVLTIILIFCVFTKPYRVHYDVDRAAFPVKGIDVSAHNGDIDFLLAKADTVTFVYIKATEGVDFCDARFNINHLEALKAGLAVGAYHFFRFDSPGDIQAQHFLATVAGRPLHLPLAIDVEKWGNKPDYDVDRVKNNLRDMVDVIKAEGYPLIIYTNKHGRESFLGGEFDDVPVWICSLSGPSTKAWILWQHSHGASVRGINGSVDLDTFNGTPEDFARWVTPYDVTIQ